MDGVCLKTENSGICACVCLCACVNLRAKMREIVFDEYRSRIFLALLKESERIWLVNLNAK